MTEEHAWLALNAAELPPRRALHLLDHYGSAPALMSVSAASVAAAGRLSSSERARFAAAQARDYQADAEKQRHLGVSLVTIRSPQYPANLRQISDPPPLLFVRGSFLPGDERCVAIVGPRKATPYGRLVSETLARGLAARGITVVSGMAVGADAAAHRGALSAGGRTIGVLACGIDVPYPRDTMELREQAAARGAVISELPFGAPAQRGRFAARNRLISGLALAVVVTEAAARSGALITANLAAEQGRVVFAVPGSVNSELSRGTHALLRDGASIAESVEDILEEVTLPDPPPASESVEERPQETAPAALSAEERSILEALSLQQKHVDDIIHECRLPSSRASASLLMLELKGLARRLPGNMYMRVR